MAKNFTIGVTAYCVEKYLRDCLESVLSVVGEDVEILIVDDGSTDQSGAIADEYGQRDGRVRVIHRENGGASSARNLIIDLASGKWITFVDGDDRLHPDAAQRFREHLCDPEDIIYFDAIFYRFDDAVAPYASSAPPLSIAGRDLRQFAETTMYPALGSPNYINSTLRACWGKLIRREFLTKNALRFSEALVLAEDLVFNLQCLRLASAVKLVREPTLLYRRTGGSAMHRYHEGILAHNELLQVKLRHIAEQWGGEMLERYYLRCVADMGSCIQLNLCHRSNPHPVSERRAAFLAMLALPWCQETLEHVNRAGLKKVDRIAYDAFVKRDYAKLSRYHRLGDFTERLKNALNRVYVHRILKLRRYNKSVVLALKRIIDKA